MTNKQPSSLAVDLSGNWRLYANIIPAGSKCLGTITTQRGETGALVFTASGIYCRLNAGALASVPQYKVKAAVDAALNQAMFA